MSISFCVRDQDDLRPARAVVWMLVTTAFIWGLAIGAYLAWVHFHG